jgi:hypothetical protein
MQGLMPVEARGEICEARSTRPGSHSVKNSRYKGKLSTSREASPGIGSFEECMRRAVYLATVFDGGEFGGLDLVRHPKRTSDGLLQIKV